MTDHPKCGKQGSIRVFIRAFVFGLLCIAVSFYLLQRAPLTDVFQSEVTLNKGNLEGLPTTHVQAAKIAHAVRHKTATIGLFGNSRAVSVSTEDLEPTSQSFFNYSVPGTSLRSTALMIEYLSERDALPDIAVISIDSFRLEYFGPAEFPILWVRWSAAFQDLVQGFRNDTITNTEVVKSTWRNVWQEWQTFTMAMNATLVRRLIFGLPEGTPSLYNLDGSRGGAETLKSGATQFDPLSQQPQQILPGYLNYDLKRLAKVQNSTDSKILIYESPLHPGAGPDTEQAQALRQQFMEACRLEGLTCAPATAINTFRNSDSWLDVSHPPARPLGKFIARFIQDNGPQSGEDAE
jgi:hypothetical protein